MQITQITPKIDRDLLKVMEEEAIETLVEWKEQCDSWHTISLKAAEALRRVRDNKLFELSGLSGAREWAEKKCGISRSWFYKLSSVPDVMGLIEDKIENEPSIKKLASKRTMKRVRALPVRALTENAAKIKRSPKKAVKAIIEVVENSKAIPTSEEITEAIDKAVPPSKLQLKSLPVKSVDHPFIIAMDKEWQSMAAGIAYRAKPISAREVYEKFRDLAVKILNT